MSQSVQLDMEVLQRFKFLMEYDVMKTSSENIVLEQSTDLQKLAKEKGFGPVSISKAQELYNQGKLGNKKLDLYGKILPDWIDNSKPDPSKTGTIDLPSTHVNRMYSQPSKEVREMRIDELTLKVRSIMSDWRTGTIETIAVMLGIGVPVVIGANGIWVTLEVAQLLKGTPSWLDLVFSIIAISTVGAGTAVLKPLYNRTAQILKGKGGKGGISEVVDAMYKAAVELGLLNKLKPILNAVSKASNTIIDVVGKTWTWLNDNVFWIFKGITWISKVSIDAMRSALTGIFNAFDNFVAYIGRKSGLDPAFSSKLGPAARVGGAVGATGYGISKYMNQPPPPTIKADDLKNLDTSDWFKD
jgi:hypothetical protein